MKTYNVTLSYTYTVKADTEDEAIKYAKEKAKLEDIDAGHSDVEELYEYITLEQMMKLRAACRKEIINGTSPEYLIGCIYGLFQDYLISEEQELELYAIVDPKDEFNEVSKYWENLDENVLEQIIR